MAKTVFSLAAIFLFCSLIRPAPCRQEQTSGAERVIGSSFKVLAKAFVLAVDLEKLKKDNISRVNSMREEKYRKQYRKAFTVIKDLPPDALREYSLSEDMPKEKAIQAIGLLDKDKIYRLIDSVPDALIAREFRKYLSSVREEIKESDLVRQIRSFWDKAIKKATF